MRRSEEEDAVSIPPSTEEEEEGGAGETLSCQSEERSVRSCRELVSMANCI